jgi:thiamine-phosphate pyrophosphorylase
MNRRPLLCYITDRTQFPGNESARRQRLLEKIFQAANGGVDYIQLREKDLSTRELENLSREVVRILSETKPSTEDPGLGTPAQRTHLLINSRTDIALAVGADGVHLRSDDISPAEVRRICQFAVGAAARVTVTIACHIPQEVDQAERAGADLALFAPVFEKKANPNTQATGLEALRKACQYRIPVLALGGVTLENAAACLQAGAAGIAAIRLFQENDVFDVARQLRNL